MFDFSFLLDGISSYVHNLTTVLFGIGITLMVRAQTSHPLDPLSAAEISVAVATVRAAGATPEVHNSFSSLVYILLGFTTM